MNIAKLPQLGLAAILLLPLNAFAIGAIAVDDNESLAVPGYGLVTGRDSKGSAQRDALKLCAKAGNDGCEVVAWFETCGAYAASQKFYGVGWGSTRDAAEGMAMGNCGNDNCEILISECE
jgi:hypothetical protein